MKSEEFFSWLMLSSLYTRSSSLKKDSRITAGCFFPNRFLSETNLNSHRENPIMSSQKCCQTWTRHRFFFWTKVQLDVGVVCFLSSTQFENYRHVKLEMQLPLASNFCRLSMATKSLRTPPQTELLLFPKPWQPAERVIDVLYTTTLEVCKSTCITSWWLNHPCETYDCQILGLSLMVGSIHYDFTSSCHAGAKQAPSHRWIRCYWGRRAYRAWGAEHQWWMHGDIECVRLHVWSWFVELDFGRSSK